MDILKLVIYLPIESYRCICIYIYLHHIYDTTYLSFFGSLSNWVTAHRCRDIESQPSRIHELMDIFHDSLESLGDVAERSRVLGKWESSCFIGIHSGLAWLRMVN